MKAGIFIALFGLLNGLLGGAWVDPAHPPPDWQTTLSLGAGERLGQGFVSAHLGLMGVEVGLWAETPARVSLGLFRGWGPEGEPLKTALLDLKPQGPAFYRLDFGPELFSHNRPYYLEVKVLSGSVRAAAAPAGLLADGALSRDGWPEESADLLLRLTYAPAGLILGLLETGLLTLYWLGLSALLLLIPGLGLVKAARGPGRLTADDLVVAGGAGLALYPLGLLWADFFGLQPGPWLIVALNALGLLALLGVYLRGRGRAPEAEAVGEPPGVLPALGSLLGLVFLVRFLVIRGLPGPQWGDSVHHAIITELIRAKGGLFNDWAPYADLTSFSYHFGFHAFSAALSWVSGAQAPEATLVAGQLLNGLAVLGLYPLGRRLFNSAWAGVFAVLLGGLLFPSPAFYVRWGRYTQLAGQVILPAALVLTLGLMGAKGRRLGLLGAAGVLVGGLLVTHYRVALFYGAFALGLGLFWAVRRGLKEPALRLLPLGLLGLGLTLPWWPRVLSGRLPHIAAEYLKPAVEIESNAFGPLLGYLPAWAWVLWAVSLGLGLWGRVEGVALLGLWSGLAFLLTNPDLLGLPGAGFVGNFTLLIGAYIPAALNLGWAGAALAERLKLKAAWVVGLLLGLGLLGAYRQLGIAEPGAHSMLTWTDLTALRWVRENTPPDSGFLINGFFAYGETVVVGADGGWWLPLLGGRRASVPPMLYVSERPRDPEYVARVNGLMAQVLERGPTDPEVVGSLRAAGIDYVYIGQKRGRVNNPTGRTLEPAELLASPAYEPVYHLNRAWVFKLRP